MLRLKKEFEFDLVIQHGTEAFKVVELLARSGVPVSMTIIDSPGGKAEVVDLVEQCGAELDKAGVPVIINTDDMLVLLIWRSFMLVPGGPHDVVAIEVTTVPELQAAEAD